MPDSRIEVRLSSTRLKAEYRRSCQLLGISMARHVQQAVQATIRRAKNQYPQAFTMLSDDQLLILEAIEEHHSTVLDMQMYARMQKVRVIELLEGLIAAGHVRETNGPEGRAYSSIRK